MAFYFFIALTAICLIVALRKKKTIFLVIPFLSIIVYFIIQVALVPLPFIETLKFIFSLN
ncbi:hypothetical protein J27TS8_30190 [Robertmurraya siralis]|uniref:Uncharacterized protein n=1 Tax=Robertmurraya siralis TaxID=77777 RepID=A0A919WJ71_9BACI|nr:hypothetical protein [Robertmurraya siralis]PAE19607.1 hypothetical protein CHH80_15260 [Bacillus sp. 7504-2]GIN63026.1 hypothetical protein J27TS8_30190 [Robertmurraya siralis]